LTEQTYRPSRRIVFQGLGALGTAVALAGCGSGSGGDDAPKPKSGSELATTSEVPVGGGLILRDDQIVITQPSEGEFRAFTAICTHQGCIVANVKDDTINCTCHGSKFSIEDGSVEGGPAPSALAAVDIKVEGSKIVGA
jgi:Rieske Fe-S protein